MTFFKPEMRVAPTPDNKDVVLSIDIVVPSSHYSIGEVKGEPPAGSVLIPEAEPVQVVLRKRGGVGTPALQTLRLSRRYPKTVGKSSFAAFVMLDDLTDNSAEIRLVGRGSISIPKITEMKASTNRSGASVAGIAAWIDKMPINDFGTIHVVVTAAAPTGGYKYRLTEFDPIDITGKAFGLELVATAPPAGVTIPTETQVTFRRELKKGEDFDHLMLQFEGEITTATIEIVS